VLSDEAEKEVRNFSFRDFDFIPNQIQTTHPNDFNLVYLFSATKVAAPE